MTTCTSRITYWTVDERAALPAIVALQVARVKRKEARQTGGPGERMLAQGRGSADAGTIPPRRPGYDRRHRLNGGNRGKV